MPPGGARDDPGRRGRGIATVNATSLREAFETAQTRVAALRAAGKAPEEIDGGIGMRCTLPSLLMAVLPEKAPGRHRRIPDRHVPASQARLALEEIGILPRTPGPRVHDGGAAYHRPCDP